MEREGIQISKWCERLELYDEDNRRKSRDLELSTS